METEKRSFDVSEGYAINTLKEAAQQAEVEFIFSADLVKGVRTPSIQGEYVPLEAFSLLLAETSLAVFQHEQSGVYAITKVSDIQNPESEPKPIEETEMNAKKNNWFKTLAAVLTIGVAGSQGQLVAQDEGEKEEIYELSPFTVDASENLGYVATSTLAGTRIKTNLSDIGSAISVITAEVFKDTGATDAETILPYALNVEVAGVQGNFADVSGGNRARSNSTAQSGQSQTRVRGLSGAVLARGLFQTDIPFDSYNTSRITINRGPNSLLFGATTPGGVIDQSLNKAQFSGDFGSFQFRIGERSSNRFVFDANKVLVKDRLVLRLSLLDDETNYQQRPTFKEDQRVYADIQALLFKGSDGGILGRTTLRVNAEYGDVDSNPAKLTPPGDGLTDWFEAPSRSLEQFTGTTFPDWVDSFVPKTTLDNRTGIFGDPATIPVSVSQPFFINMSLWYSQPDLQVASMGIPGMEEVQGMPGRTLWRGEGGRPFRVDAWATFPFAGRSEFSPGFTVPSVQDRNVFDNQNMAIVGTLSYRNSDFDVQNISLEQELFGGKGGLELAYDRQSFENAFYDPLGGNSGNPSGNAFRGNEIRIDLNEYLPNEQPNPNLGRPFMVDFATPHNFGRIERESKRLTGFYELNFADKDGFARKLGRHVFTGFYSEDSVDRMSTASQNKWVDAPGSGLDVRTLVNDRLNGERRNAPMMIYFGDSLLGSDIQSVSDIRISQFATIPAPKTGDIALNHFHSFFPSPINTTDPSAPLDSGTFEVYRSLVNGDARREENEAKAFSWQSFLFNGNLVGLFGWRDDSFETIENISLANFIIDTPGANTDGLLDSGEFDRRRIRIADKGNPDHANEVVNVSDETITWSLVGHLPEEVLKLPFGAGLSVHYNESESFVPTRSRRDFNGGTIAPESGATKEYGFTISTRDNKLSARVNFFELKQTGASAIGGPGAPGGIPGWLRFWKDAELNEIDFEDALLTGLTTRPALSPDITTYADMYDAIIGVLPQTQQDLFNFRFAPDGRTVLFDANPGQTVTTNAIAEGVEVDLIGNINDNWAVMLNYGKQETTTSDSAPIAGDFVLAVAENLRTSGLAGVTFTPSLFEFAPMGTNWNGNVNALNSLRGKDGIVSLEQRKHRVNFLTTYSFLSDSRLSGLTIGGALRWQSSIATGYETEVNDGVVTPIVSKPFLGPDELNGDVWISYVHKIKPFGTPLDWKIQLNVRNAIGSDDYIPVVTNPDGRVAVVRNPPTREFFLTNTFSF